MIRITRSLLTLLLLFVAVVANAQGSKTITLVPNVWDVDGAVFATYAFNGEGNEWFAFEKVDEVYTAQIPESFTGIILVRLKPATDEGYNADNNGLNWDNKWNQTADIDFTAIPDFTQFTITGWGQQDYIAAVDFTTKFIVNANLTGTDGWNIDGTKGYHSVGGVVTAGNNAQFDFSQVIKNLPAGQYKLTAQAAYRYGGDEATEAAAIAEGTDTKLAKLYATTAKRTFEAKVMNRYDGASETDYANGDGSVLVNGKYVPNSTKAIKAWFNNGQYVNEVVFNLAEEGNVTIGIVKNAQPEAGDYTVIGPWTLTRLGDAQPEPNIYTATFTTNAGWEEVWAYVWSGNGENKVLGEWPGTKLEAVEGVYTVTIEAAQAPEKIIFNNGGNGAQTADLDFEDGKAYEYTIDVPEPITAAFADGTYYMMNASTGKLVAANGLDKKGAPLTFTFAENEGYTIAGSSLFADKKWVAKGDTYYTFSTVIDGVKKFAAVNTAEDFALIEDGAAEAAVWVLLTQDYWENEALSYNVAGTANLCGAEWDVTANKMTKNAETGLYEWKAENITVSNEVKPEFKVTLNNVADPENVETIAWYPGGDNWVINPDVTNGEGVFTITITFNAATEEIDVDAVKTGEIGQPELNTYTATFTTNAGWEEVYAYAWSSEGESVKKFLGEWPGTKLDAVEGVYTVTIKAEAAPEKIIFNNGITGENAAQTADLDFEDGKAYVYNVDAEAEDINLYPTGGDIAAQLEEAKAKVAKVGNIKIELAKDGVYTIGSTLTAPNDLTIWGNDATVTVETEEPFITLDGTEKVAMKSETEESDHKFIASVAVAGVKVVGLKNAFIKDNQKTYVEYVEVAWDNIEMPAGKVVFDFNGKGYIGYLNVNNSTIWAKEATGFFVQYGSRPKNINGDWYQTFNVHNNTLVNIATGKNMCDLKQNGTAQNEYFITHNIFVDCGKENQVIVGFNKGQTSATSAWDVSGNYFEWGGACVNAEEIAKAGQKDEEDIVKNCVEGKLEFTDAANGDFNGVFTLAEGAQAPQSLGSPMWTITFNEYVPVLDIKSMSIVGDFTGGWPVQNQETQEWDWTMALPMYQDAENTAIWTATIEGFEAEAKKYEYKAAANNSWDGYKLPDEGNADFEFGTEMYPAGKYNLTFTVDTENNTLTLDVEPVKTIFTATFTTNAGWEEVYAYAWTGNELFLGEWPGTKLEAVEGVYTVNIEAAQAPEKIIFNNGGNGAQTADLDFENGKAYEFTLADEWLAIIANAKALIDPEAVAVGKLIAAINVAEGIAVPNDENKAALQAAVDQFKLDNADQEKDETAKVATDGWIRFDGNRADLAPNWAAPSVTTYDGRTSQPAEVYEQGDDAANRTGNIIYQDITGLTNGKYKVGFYGTAYFTPDRGFESDMEDGATDVAYVFANDEKSFITAHRGVSFTEYDLMQFDVEVTDGNIKLGLGKEKAGTNWHTMQIHQLTWFTTAKEVFSELLNEFNALLFGSAVELDDENNTKGREEFQAAFDAAKVVKENISMYNIPEMEAEVAKLKSAIETFIKAQWFIEFPAGEYYVIDAESGLKMAAGNDWGTRGMINEFGLDLTLIPHEESRTVTFDSRVYNGDNSHFLGENLYMDSSEWGWALKYQGFGFYIIEPNSGKYINVDLYDNNLVLSDTPREWILVSKEGVKAQLLEELAEATAENPVDATALIVAHDFNRNDARNAEAWTISEDCTNSNLSGGNQMNNCAESYHSTFTIMQTISGAPAGKYTLTAQGFYRQDEYEGEEAPAAPVFFANGVNGDVPVKTGEENGMIDASESFTNKLYTIEPIEFEVTEDGMIYVGITAAVANQWVIWDNFRLTYYGPTPVEEPVYTVVGTVGTEEAGVEDVLFGKTWDPTIEENNMVKGEDGVYSITFESVPLEAGTIFYKVVKNHSWDENWGFTYKSENNADYNVTAAGVYDITFKFVPEGTLSENGLSVACILNEGVGIKSVNAENGNAVIYNMQGVRVDKAQKGLYIVNGKKQVLK